MERVDNWLALASTSLACCGTYQSRTTRYTFQNPLFAAHPYFFHPIDRPVGHFPWWGVNSHSKQPPHHHHHFQPYFQLIFKYTGLATNHTVMSGERRWHNQELSHCHVSSLERMDSLLPSNSFATQMSTFLCATYRTKCFFFSSKCVFVCFLAHWLLNATFPNTDLNT